MTKKERTRARSEAHIKLPLLFRIRLTHHLLLERFGFLFLFQLSSLLPLSVSLLQILGSHVLAVLVSAGLVLNEFARFSVDIYSQTTFTRVKKR